MNKDNERAQAEQAAALQEVQDRAQHAVDKAAFQARQTAFAQLLTNPTDLQQVFHALQDIIMRSFAREVQSGLILPVRVTMTDAEIRRRFLICEKWFRVMRGDKKWTLDRTLACLGWALQLELEGREVDPDQWSSSIY